MTEEPNHDDLTPAERPTYGDPAEPESSGASQPSYFVDPTPPQRQTGLIVALVFTSIVLVALIAVQLTNRGNDNAPTEAAQITPTAPEASLTDTTSEPSITTTTQPPETSTSTSTTTTTQAPVQQSFTMWDALVESGEAGQFAAVGGTLGLQDFLEEIEDDNGETVMRTLFAPSDAALAALGPEAVGAIAGDPNAATQLVGYHVLDQTLTAEELLALDGQNVNSSVGLPIAVSFSDGDLILNGNTMVTVTDLVANNGIVHIVDVVLMPPTINQILDLDNIEFEVSSATLTAAGQDTLQRAVAFFTENPNVNAVVEGHTDTDGNEEVNQELSQARAESVVNFLVANGLEESRFTPQGFGETQPILVDGVEDKEASRRIEFVAQ